MIADFSPLTRRLLAIGLLILALLLAVRLATAVAGGVGGALESLDDSRFALARLEALRRRSEPPRAPPLQPGLAIAAASHEAAGEAAAGRIAGAASGKVLIDSISLLSQDAANPRLVRISIAARGREPELLAFIQALEQPDPPIRLHEWSIAAPSPGAAELTLQATALAAWGDAG
jgi:hypothetical protein